MTVGFTFDLIQVIIQIQPSRSLSHADTQELRGEKYLTNVFDHVMHLPDAYQKG